MKPENGSHDLEVVDFDTKSEPGFIKIAFIDGHKEKYRVNDPEFLNREFKLVPTQMDD